MLSNRLILFVFFCLVLATPGQLMAVSTHRVVHRTPDDFGKGKLDHIVVTEDGHLTLAPEYTRIAEIPDPIIWKTVVDAQGDIYLATGNEGRIYRIAAGKDTAEVFADFEALQVLTLALDSTDRLYAATSPDGKVYRIAPGTAPVEVANPEARYIWEMLFDEDGNLLVATGDPGAVLKIDPAGKIETVLETEEKHILCLARGPSGELYAGSADNGYVYQVVSANRKVSLRVLLDAPGQEVKRLLVVPDGSVIALTLGGDQADSGDKERKLSGLLQRAASSEDEKEAPQKTTVYRLMSDRAPETLWEAPELTGHSLGFHQGQILVGAGDEGKVVALSLDRRVSLLADCSGEQVTSMTRAGDALWVAVSNPAAVFRMEDYFAKKGTYTSDVVDSGLFALWGRIDLLQELPERGLVKVRTRSGNTDKPNKTWSEWVDLEDTITSPSSRYLQYQLLLHDKKGEAPRVRSVSVYFRPMNSRPLIEEIQVMDPDIRLELKEDFRGEPPSRGINQPKDPDSEPQVKKKESPGAQSVSWKASDEDDDTLSYSVAIREAGGQRWRMLAENQMESFANIDATALADGWYQFRIIARDRPSNLPGEVLEDEKTSAPFPVDHTPPTLVSQRSKVEGDRVNVELEAFDETTYLSAGRYSIDGGPFVPLFPDDQVFDGHRERFSFSTESLSGGDHMIVATLEDGVGNVVTGKFPVSIP